MEIHDYDVVKLKSGQKATVLETYEGGKAFLVETSVKSLEESDLLVVKKEDISKVIWKQAR